LMKQFDQMSNDENDAARRKTSWKWWAEWKAAKRNARMK
jgi:hypothetical protein